MRASLIAYRAAIEGSSAAEYEDAWRVLPGTADEVPGNWVALAEVAAPVAEELAAGAGSAGGWPYSKIAALGAAVHARWDVRP